MIQRLILPLLIAAGLQAQAPDLKTLMNLSDDQIQSLVQIQQQKAQALQPVVQQVQQAQQKLEQLLANNPDPATVGQLVIQITAIQRQVQQAMANFQQQALNVLNSDQKAQAQTLGNVLKLQLAAQQALNLGLVLPPN